MRWFSRTGTLTVTISTSWQFVRNSPHPKPWWGSALCFQKNQCDSENLDHSESLVFVGIEGMNHAVVGG